MSHRTGATNLNWIFAANSGRIGNDDSLKHRCVNGPKPWFATEHSWCGGCGLTIPAEILPVPSNSLLVQVLNVSVGNKRELIEGFCASQAAIKRSEERRVGNGSVRECVQRGR